MRSGYIGGIVGIDNLNNNVTKCYNKGKVQSNVEGSAGGIGFVQSVDNKAEVYSYNGCAPVMMTVLNNVAFDSSIKFVNDDINSFDEFLTWIETSH